jgi:hypothetical protein
MPLPWMANALLALQFTRQHYYTLLTTSLCHILLMTVVTFAAMDGASLQMYSVMTATILVVTAVVRTAR